MAHWYRAWTDRQQWVTVCFLNLNSTFDVYIIVRNVPNMLTIKYMITEKEKCFI